MYFIGPERVKETFIRLHVFDGDAEMRMQGPPSERCRCSGFHFKTALFALIYKGKQPRVRASAGKSRRFVSIALNVAWVSERGVKAQPQAWNDAKVLRQPKKMPSKLCLRFFVVNPFRLGNFLHLGRTVFLFD